MKSKLITDEQISPYDKIGTMMAKKTTSKKASIEKKATTRKPREKQK